MLERTGQFRGKGELASDRRADKQHLRRGTIPLFVGFANASGLGTGVPDQQSKRFVNGVIDLAGLIALGV